MSTITFLDAGPIKDGGRSIGVPSHLAARAAQNAKITEIHTLALIDTRDCNKELSGQ